jgi:competence protein ComQ
MDDLQDKDNPDKPWMKCPEAFALNAVMALLMAAVGDIARIEALELANGRMPGDSLAAGISRFIADAVNGQQRDINDSITTEQDYVQMVYEKSGSLVKLACYLGYALAERRDPGTVQQMDEVATLVGFMAQLQNDIADVMRWDLKNDIFFKRKTLPLQFLLEVSEEDFPDLKRFYDGEITQDDLIRVKRECMQFILDSGCIEYSKTIQLLHLNRAEEVLAAMDVVPEWKERFAKLAFDPFRV